MTLRVLPFALACSAWVALPALAQNSATASPYYGGLSLGLFTINDSSATTNATLLSALGGTANVSQESNGYMGRAFGGTHLDASLSLELGYYQTASIAQKITGVASNGAAYSGSTSLSLSGWDYSLLLRPNRALNHKGAFLRLGGHYLTVSGSATLTATSAIANASSYSGSGFLWGAGYDMPLKESLDLRLEYLGVRNIAGKDGTTDNFCITAVKHF